MVLLEAPLLQEKPQISKKNWVIRFAGGQAQGVEALEKQVAELEQDAQPLQVCGIWKLSPTKLGHHIVSRIQLPTATQC